MHPLTMAGLVLAAGIIVTDRYICVLPAFPAMLLYSMAVILSIAGLIRSENGKRRGANQ